MTTDQTPADDRPARTRTVTKTCKTLRGAGQHQNRLYAKHPYVRLVRWPVTSEEGQYQWEVG